MAGDVQHPAQDARAAVRAIAAAHSYLEAISKGEHIPLTPADLRQAIDDFKAVLKKHELRTNAWVLAVVQDQPCPQSLYAPWASVPQIWYWRKAEKDPLPTVELNGKVCIKPTDFFRALAVHGKPKEAAA
jgi:hypothetical protein